MYAYRRNQHPTFVEPPTFLFVDQQACVSMCCTLNKKNPSSLFPRTKERQDIFQEMCTCFEIETSNVWLKLQSTHRSQWLHHARDQVSEISIDLSHSLTHSPSFARSCIHCLTHSFAFAQSSIHSSTHSPSFAQSFIHFLIHSASFAWFSYIRTHSLSHSLDLLFILSHALPHSLDLSFIATHASWLALFCTLFHSRTRLLGLSLSRCNSPTPSTFPSLSPICTVVFQFIEALPSQALFFLVY